MVKGAGPCSAAISVITINNYNYVTISITVSCSHPSQNLEVWRQLWRVLERSDVVVQVVDARDPMRYWSQVM